MTLCPRPANTLPWQRLALGGFLCLYCLLGLYTELRLIERKPLPEMLLEDFGYYQRALSEALERGDPYHERSIGLGFLYPPPALLVVEAFSHLPSLPLRAAMYTLVNTLLLSLMTLGVARHYGYSVQQTWHWYVLCLGFAPFLELLHIGQINVITMFGLFLLFWREERNPFVAGSGLAVAIVTKVTPLLFVGYLLVRRRFKVIAFLAIGLLALTALAAWRYGFSPLFAYPQVFQWLVRQLPLGVNSQSLVAKLAVANAPEVQAMVARLPEAMQITVTSLLRSFNQHQRLIQTSLSIYILALVSASAALTWFGRKPREPLFLALAFAMVIAPNVLWYHHYVFFLLPVFIWMGWRHLERRVVAWCYLGLLIIQFDRFFPPYGFFIHLWAHASLMTIVLGQAAAFIRQRHRPEHPARIVA